MHYNILAQVQRNILDWQIIQYFQDPERSLHNNPNDFSPNYGSILFLCPMDVQWEVVISELTIQHFFDLSEESLMERRAYYTCNATH